MGRISEAKAKGSALSGKQAAALALDLEFIGNAWADIGNEDFPHAGVAPSRMTWRRPSHWLKSPTTETRAALGAQTAK